MNGDGHATLPVARLPRVGRLLAAVFAIAVPAGLVLLAVGMFPAGLPANRSPDFIDTIFDNRGVIWAARLLFVSAAGVLAFGGVFIVVSTGIRMKNREWLRRAGPFEISETAVSEIEGQIEFWREAAVAGYGEVEELSRQLNESDELIEKLQEAIEELIEVTRPGIVDAVLPKERG